MNVRDAFADMPASDAVVMDNVFPEANNVVVRRRPRPARLRPGRPGRNHPDVE
jgi:hypothetical protein